MKNLKEKLTNLFKSVQWDYIAFLIGALIALCLGGAVIFIAYKLLQVLTETNYM